MLRWSALSSVVAMVYATCIHACMLTVRMQLFGYCTLSLSLTACVCIRVMQAFIFSVVGDNGEVERETVYPPSGE